MVRELLSRLCEPAWTAILTVALIAGAVAVVLAVETHRRDSWMSWVREHGSSELRALLPETWSIAQTFDEPDFPPGVVEALLRADVSRALTPPLADAQRCSGSVQLGKTIAMPDQAAQRTMARVNAAVSTVPLPEGASVTVGVLHECWVVESKETRLCVPVSFVDGKFAVSSCYFLNARATPG